MSTENTLPSRQQKRGQYRIRSLMFTTFVVALCGALFQISVVIGCMATIPATLALIFTLGGRQHRRHGLLFTFGQSILVIHCLVVTLLLNLIAIAGTVCFFVLYSISSACARASIIAVFVFAEAMTIADRSRRVNRLVGLKARGIASKLHQTNRSLIAMLQS